MLRIAVVLAAALGTSRCATNLLQFSPEDATSLSAKIYESASLGQVIEAAGLVLVHARYEGVGITQDDGEVVADLPSGGGGNYAWRFGAKERSGTVLTGVSVTPPVGVAATTASPAPVTAPEPEATYDLFWGRMDYLLGQRPDWPTCVDAAKQGGIGSPRFFGLCQANTDFPPPDRLVTKGDRLTPQ